MLWLLGRKRSYHLTRVRIDHRSMVVVPRVGVQDRILVIPVSVSVEAVRAALADHVDLTTRGAPEAGVVVGDADAELFDAVHADRHDRHLVATTPDHLAATAYPAPI